MTKGVNVIFLTGVMTPWFERSIGAYQMSSFLKNYGYTTQVIDFLHLISEEDLLNLLKKFTGTETKVLGVSTTFLSSEAYVDSTRKKTPGDIPSNLNNCLIEYKKLFPNVKIIAGGAKAKQFSIMPEIDHIITGYGELAMLNFLESGSNEKVINGDAYLKHFNAHLINHKFCDNDFIFNNETLPLEISRGCIFKCKFCAYPLNGKKKLDHIRNVELIKEELINNYEKWGITNYLISDDTFNDNNEKLKMLHDMILDLPFKINFVCYLRIDLLYHYKDTQLEMLERMGLKSCHFGIESFNPTTAKFVGKGLSEDKTKDFLIYLQKRWKNKISFLCTFITGLPFETKESCIETGIWCQENKIEFWMMPLIINPNHTYKSDIDINYKNYGYELDKNFRWKSKYMTFDEAIEISRRFTSNPKNFKVSAWNMFSIMSIGLHSADELYHMTFEDLQEYKEEMERIRNKKLRSYILKLMSRDVE